MSEEEVETTVNYREEVLRLVGEGNIRHTNKFVEKASDETLEKIYKNYLAKQLDETNEHVTDTLIKPLSELMTSLELIDDGESLKKDLGDNELFKKRRKKRFKLRDALHSVRGISMRRNLHCKIRDEEKSRKTKGGGVNVINRKKR